LFSCDPTREEGRCRLSVSVLSALCNCTLEGATERAIHSALQEEARQIDRSIHKIQIILPSSSPAGDRWRWGLPPPSARSCSASSSLPPSPSRYAPTRVSPRTSQFLRRRLHLLSSEPQMDAYMQGRRCCSTPRSSSAPPPPATEAAAAATPPPTPRSAPSSTP
jgi:hypothetical protein